ncbi:MAG: hypothetical protein J6O73_01715 [Lachnospiraceae bacterium]|nr:hypothetical protein [Lachnospiraceae bacterium]
MCETAKNVKNMFEKMDWGIVAGFSILLMLIQMLFNGHAFLVDDNAIQFYPVIDKVYSSWLISGRLPFYDFFQMKGMIIGDEGYYCQTSILMFVSWFLTKSILPGFDCLTLYGIICVMFGNLGWNLLFRKMGFSVEKRLLAISLETTSSVFIYFGYWYYAFNSYIIIPFLLVTTCQMLTENRKCNSYLSGLVLFFSLMLGNVQFTVYHYMVFGIVALLYIIIKKCYAKARDMLSNIVIGVGVSAPVLVSQLNAATRRDNVVGDVDLFFWNSIKLRDWLLNGMLPGWLIKKSKISVIMDDFGVNNQIFMPGMICCFLIFGMIVLRRLFRLLRMQKPFAGIEMDIELCDSKLVFLCCGFICTWFFIIFQAGKGYGIADLIHILPVINQFRLLDKLSVIIAPLMSLTFIYIVDRYTRIGMLLGSIAVLLGIVQNMYIMKSDESWMYNELMRRRVNGIYEYEQMHQELSQAGVDLNNYRILGMSSDMDIFGDDHYDARFLPANFPTLFGMYSLGGYEMAAMEKGFRATEGFFIDIGYDYSLSGQARASLLLRKKEDGNFLINEILAAMMSNATKYYMFRNDVVEEKSFLEMVTRVYGMPTPQTVQLSNGYRIYVLEDAPKLCEGADMAESKAIDQLTFRVNEDYDKDFLRVNFSKNEGLKSYAVVNGGKKELQLMEDEKGNILIPMEDELKGADIVIFYGNIGDNVLLYYGIVGALIAMIVVLQSVRKGDDGSADPVEKV